MFGLDRLLKVIDPEPVIINQEACLRARHANSPCRACFDVCPVDAIGFAERRLAVDVGQCTRCALCLGACPTGALQVRGIDEKRLDGAAQVRCQQAVGEGAVLPCLGALSVDHVVDLGSRRPGVVLLAGNCDACTLASGGRRAQETLQSAGVILRSLGVEELPKWRTGRGGAEPTERQTVSRRDLLSLWGQEAVQTGRTLLPERQVNPVELPARVPARRLRWLRRFVPPEQPTTLPWPDRRVSRACSGCPICTSFCPTGALCADTTEDAWKLTFQAAACVDCGTCVELCPRRALSPGESQTVSELVSGAQRVLAEVDTKAKKPGSAYGGITFDDLS